MAATKKHKKVPGLKKTSASGKEPQIKMDKESRRFIQTFVWVVIICAMFMVGQGLRFHYNRVQLIEINNEIDNLYASVLGSDFGSSPFGRLQFEQGKLAASRRIGLDPLSVLASLSRPATESLRLEGLTLTGKTVRVRGFFGPNVDRFDDYLDDLSEDDHYSFLLGKREEVFGGITFSLIVEAK